MHLRNLYTPAAVLLTTCLLVFSSCKKDDHDHHEEELITTIKVSAVPAGGGDALTFYWRDLDGEGGNPPVIDTIRLSAGIAYQVSLALLNESFNPADDITGEISEESRAHLFIYEPGFGGLSVEITDTDSDGRPLGLQSNWTCGNTASEGDIRILLKHEADKTASNPGATGSTDIDITMPVVIR